MIFAIKFILILNIQLVEKTNFKKIINECNYLEEDFVDYYFNVVLVDDFYFDNFNDDNGAEEYFLY